MEHARDQPGNGIHHDHRREFPSGQHIISDGHIIRHDLLQHPLVDPFVMPAEKHQLFFFCKFFRHSLVKGLSLRRKIDHPGLFADPLLQGPVALINRLCLHQHPGSAPVGVIVHTVVLIKCIIPDIYSLNT